MHGFSISNQKIDPTRRPAAHRLKPDGSPDDNDRVEIGPTRLAFDEWAALGLTAPHLPSLRAYRHQRLVEAINARGYAGVLLFDPLNIRYATDTHQHAALDRAQPRAAPVWSSRLRVTWFCSISTTASTSPRICRWSGRCVTAPASSISKAAIAARSTPPAFRRRRSIRS